MSQPAAANLRMVAMTMGFGCLMMTVACAPEDSCPPTYRRQGECVFDENAVAELVTRFTESGFVRINEQPFDHLRGDVMSCSIWVSETDLDATVEEQDSAASIYGAIEPLNTSSVISNHLPMGTMLIHHSADHPPFGVMVKRGERFAPADNDWWFARFYPDGTRAPVEETEYGTSCRECHSLDGRAERTDMLWGVPVP